MIDETSDVSVTEQLILYFCYMQNDGNIKTSFGGIALVSSCTGKNVHQECVNFLEKNKFHWRKRMQGLESDGAISMTVVQDGVCAQFKKKFLLSYKYIA